MKKRFNKALSLFLATLMLMSCFAAGGSASHCATSPVMNREQWDAYYEEVSGGFGLCELTPGSDESQMGFSWHSATSEAAPVINVSVNADMSEAEAFTGKSVAAQGSSQVNRVTADGLVADTIYYYTYGTADAQSQPEAFRTGNGDDFTFLYMGDVHVSADDETDPDSLSNTAMLWSNTLSQILNRNSQIDFVLSVGDQASAGLGTEMEGLYAAPALRNIGIATIIGNHEKKAYEYGYYGNKPNEYSGVASSFIGGDYWFRYGNTLFMALDSTSGSGSDHYAFVKQAIADNPDVRWRVCTLHHDLYGGAYSDNSEMDLMRTYFDPIFNDFDIDLVLQGHSHYYGRTHGLLQGRIAEDCTGLDSITDVNGTVFMVCGSVNRMHYDTYPATPSAVIAKNCVVHDILYTHINVVGDALSIKTYTLSDNTLVDDFTINKTAENTFDDADDPQVFTVFAGIVGTIYTIIDKIINIFRKMGIDFDF